MDAVSRFPGCTFCSKETDRLVFLPRENAFDNGLDDNGRVKIAAEHYYQIAGSDAKASNLQGS